MPELGRLGIGAIIFLVGAVIFIVNFVLTLSRKGKVISIDSVGLMVL